MSLLLDALKKAAKDKNSADKNINAQSNDDELLVLDDIEPLKFEQESNSAEEARRALLNDEAGDNVNEVKSNSTDVSANQQPDNVAESSRESTTQTVSDEALQELVHKANKQIKSSQKKVWGAVLGATLTLLIMCGVYFYYSMTDDIASIDRKHNIVMQSVTDTRLSRSVTQKIEQQKAIAEAERKKQESLNNPPVKSLYSASVVSKKHNKKLSIKKIIKPDLINGLIIKAWNNYSKGHYQQAEKIYRKILKREKNNRDALLGVAAIAIKQNDIDSARSIYAELIELNPRDPIAVAALFNLGNVNVDRLSESKLKLMIRKNEDVSHLHFALGNIYSQQKRWPEAQQSYFSAWQDNNLNANYAFNLAVSLDQMGQQAQAIKFYKISLANAENMVTHFTIESVHLRLAQITNGQNK